MTHADNLFSPWHGIQLCGSPPLSAKFLNGDAPIELKDKYPRTLRDHLIAKYGCF